MDEDKKPLDEGTDEETTTPEVTGEEELETEKEEEIVDEA